LEVKDDGKGFELSKVRRGLGLTNIKNRAELFGGHEEIISAPGKGCTLRVYIPYGQEEND
jgi:signal transduction histidine kinase